MKMDRKGKSGYPSITKPQKLSNLKMQNQQPSPCHFMEVKLTFPYLQLKDLINRMDHYIAEACQYIKQPERGLKLEAKRDHGTITMRTKVRCHQSKSVMEIQINQENL